MSGWTLSNLELQKISYIAEMMKLGRSGEPLIKEDFEAWANGPVVPQLYHAVKAYGAGPVKDVFRDPVIAVDDPDYVPIYDAFMFMKGMNPGQMVAETHWRHGAWAKRYIPGTRGVVIPKHLIRDEYAARADVN